VLDTILPPRFGRSVADAIANARFDVMPGQAHTPICDAGHAPTPDPPQRLPRCDHGLPDPAHTPSGTRRAAHRFHHAERDPV